MYNELYEVIIDNRYARFMIRRAEGRRRKVLDSDDEYAYEKNPLFGHINVSPRCGIALHVTPTKKKRKNRDGTETQYLLQDEYKVCRKKMMLVCLECA